MEGVAALFACAAGQQANEDDTNGVFTARVVEALKKARTGAEKISFFDLAKAGSGQVRVRAAKLPGASLLR